MSVDMPSTNWRLVIPIIVIAVVLVLTILIMIPVCDTSSELVSDNLNAKKNISQVCKNFNAIIDQLFP